MSITPSNHLVYPSHSSPSWRWTAGSIWRKLQGNSFSATYELAGDGGLKALYQRGDNVSRAAMSRADFASLTRPDAVVAWTLGKSEFLQTDLVEDGKPVRLEVVIFRPSGAG